MSREKNDNTTGTADYAHMRRMIANGKVEGMDLLFDTYATTLLSVILRLVPDLERAEEILIDLIERVWKDRNELPRSNDVFFTWLIAKTRESVDGYFLS